MTYALLRRPETGLGRPMALLGWSAVGLGLLAFLLGLVLGRPDAVFAALDASWLFFAGLAAGGVALAAAFLLTGGRWAEPLVPIALACEAFFAPALGLLAVLLLGARHLFPWAAASGATRLLGAGIRLIVATGALFALGRRLAERARRSHPAARERGSAAVLYVLAYAVVLSLWAFELVMELAGGPPATVLPAYYFLGAFLSGLSWVALVATLRGAADGDARHDLGKLLFGFIVVWSYLLWALFLATWYANVPEESVLLLRRWRGPWRPVSGAVLVAVFAWPFWLLFSERLKRRRGTLALGAATILLGLWGERFLLVLPSLRLEGGAVALALGAGVSLGVAGLFLLSFGARLAAAGEGRAPGG